MRSIPAMKKRRRGNAEPGELLEATPTEAQDAALARALAAGEDPEGEEESEEEEREKSEEEVPAKEPSSRAAKAIATWADNTAKVERWLETRGGALGPQLEGLEGGLLRLRDFFPKDIADATLRVIESLPESAWELSEAAGEDDAARHKFWSADLTDIPDLLPLRSVFWGLLKNFRGEATLPIFSIARYGASDNIGRHDDRAHVPFFSDTNIFSRTVAAIWYLTREWSEEDGGSFLDLGEKVAPDASKLVPVYNSLVAFEVPHMHAVSAVTGSRYRYSVFGWWHQKGKRYELPTEGVKQSAGKKRKAKENEATEGSGAGASKASSSTGDQAPPKKGQLKKKKRREAAPEPEKPAEAEGSTEQKPQKKKKKKVTKS